MGIFRKLKREIKRIGKQVSNTVAPRPAEVTQHVVHHAPELKDSGLPAPTVEAIGPIIVTVPASDSYGQHALAQLPADIATQVRGDNVDWLSVPSSSLLEGSHVSHSLNVTTDVAICVMLKIEARPLSLDPNAAIEVTVHAIRATLKLPKRVDTVEVTTRADRTLFRRTKMSTSTTSTIHALSTSDLDYIGNALRTAVSEFRDYM